MTNPYNVELNRRVEDRITEVHDLIVAHQLRAEKDSPNDPLIKQARVYIKTHFGRILPPVVQPESFQPPSLTPNPFAQVTFDDLTDDDEDDVSEDPAARLAEINELLNRPGLNNEARLDLIKEMRILRSQLAE